MIDEMIEYDDANGNPCSCRVRVSSDQRIGREGHTVVLATDQSDRYECMSLTNSVERLRAAVCQRFAIAPERLTLIEHYEESERRPFPETFDLVLFPNTNNREPEWQHLPKEDIRLMFPDELSIYSDEVSF